MEDPTRLREQAARSSRLANNTHDKRLRGLLLAVAAEFAARAIAAEAAREAANASMKHAA